jgi:hypothetical protein
MATLALRRGLGWILNKLGVPGFMRAAPCEHRLGIPVEVKVDKLFTVVHVKKMKLFFDRVTGRYDGLALEGEECQGSDTKRS